MILRLKSLITGDGMKARAIRGTVLSIIGFGGSQFIRLASNLILTRILFPEAFGLMALVQVLLSGLDNFSDLGIGPSIIQSKRGEDPKFLNTAWSTQIIRGIILWIVACLMAAPIAEFYDQAELLPIIPVLALTTIINGFASTRIHLANRNLTLGSITTVEMGSQVLGTALMILMALWLQSVWALVIGSLFGSFFRAALSHLLIPGPRNRLAWDSSAFWEIFHFGKYIFFATIAGFFVQQGDRLILGKFVTLTDLAIFTIALMLATVPQMLNQHLVDRVLFPLYRNRPPAESQQNRYKIGQARGLLIGGSLILTAFFALTGDFVVTFLYDERYHLAGAYLVLLSLSIMPKIIFGGYNWILLANGNSRDFTIMVTGMALLRVFFLVYFVGKFGMIGAVMTPVVVDLLGYPLQVFFTWRYRGLYFLQDFGFVCLAIAIAALTFWVNPDAVNVLSGIDVW